MPMGVVTDSEFENQVNNVTKYRPSTDVPQLPMTNEIVIPSAIDGGGVVEGEVVDNNGGHVSELRTRGRNLGDVNVPNSLRSLIAGTAAVEGRQEALSLGAAFGISPSSVSAYSNGATSTKSYHDFKKEIKDVIHTRKRHASKKALTRLHKAMDNITNDKLEHLSAKDLAGIAKDMAGVVKIMSPEEGHQSGPLVAFQLFAPATREESSYEAVHASE